MVKNVVLSPALGVSVSEEGLCRAFRVDRIVALGLLLLGAPVFAVIGLAVWVTSGRPILYRGERLGCGRGTFMMYKFRTLTENAQQEIGAALVNGATGCVTPFGKWLRATRLDELPQLWNIARGDMRFIGPRPERPEIYDTQCREIPGYDSRFRVAPGLIGYAQVYTPHGTPKSIRARVDNRLTGHRCPAAKQVRLVSFTAWVVIKTTVRKLVQEVEELASRHRSGHPSALRRLERRKLHNAWLQVADMAPATGGEKEVAAPQLVRIVDINEAAFRVRFSNGYRPPAGNNEFELKIEMPGPNGHPRIRRARCTGTTIATRSAGGAQDYVVAYEPLSALSDYNIQQHFLRGSMAEH